MQGGTASRRRARAVAYLPSSPSSVRPHSHADLLSFSRTVIFLVSLETDACEPRHWGPAGSSRPACVHSSHLLFFFPDPVWVAAAAQRSACAATHDGATPTCPGNSMNAPQQLMPPPLPLCCRDFVACTTRARHQRQPWNPAWALRARAPSLAAGGRGEVSQCELSAFHNRVHTLEKNFTSSFGEMCARCLTRTSALVHALLMGNSTGIHRQM